MNPEIMQEKDRIRRMAEAFIAEESHRAPPFPIKEIGYYDQQNMRGITKAGVLPFYRDDERKMHFYLMKPKANPDRKYDMPPQFQICKGTREYQYQTAKGWQWEECKPKNRKMRTGDKPEPLFVTAIREGIEEIGLRPSTILRSFEWGRATYQGQQTDRPRTLWLYAVEVAPDATFSAHSEALADTAQQQWFSWPPTDQNKTQIRADYVALLDEITPQLSEALDNAPRKSDKKTITLPPRKQGSTT